MRRPVKAAFIGYLTLFQSRLGSLNVVLDETGLAQQTVDQLLRKLRRRLQLSEAVTHADTDWGDVVAYLQEKSYLEGRARDIRERGSKSDLEKKRVRRALSRLRWTSSSRSPFSQSRGPLYDRHPNSRECARVPQSGD